MHIDAILYNPNSWNALIIYQVAFELLDIPIYGPSAKSQNLAFNKIVKRASFEFKESNSLLVLLLNLKKKDCLGTDWS